MALPAEGRLAPAPAARPVHELAGVLQRRHSGERGQAPPRLSGHRGTRSQPITRRSCSSCGQRLWDTDALLSACWMSWNEYKRWFIGLGKVLIEKKKGAFSLSSL